MIKNIKKIDETTSIGSAMGSVTDPNGGFFIGPLSPIKKSVLNKRLLYPNKGMKSKVVDPPQGYMTESDDKTPEYLYNKNGDKITYGEITEWFSVDKTKKPAFNGGKLVEIEPKCETFPYCSQGAVDKPIKLIGRTKNEMCESCYSFINEIANKTKKTPEYITEIIRDEYLSYKY